MIGVATLVRSVYVFAVGEVLAPSVGSGERKARLAPLVPRYGASVDRDGARGANADGAQFRSAEVYRDGSHIRCRVVRPATASDCALVADLSGCNGSWWR